ncbi:MAG: hypothetical protein KJO77_08435, partial [Bacteroidia bacterium]|nr:hypothetical protein [Bacteroidia bacterium]
ALISCSSSDNSGNTNNNNNNNNADCIANGAEASVITGNHGHSLVVPSADVNAGVEKDYSIDGTANHGHMVTITAANFTSLSANQQIVVTSSNSAGHMHSVTVTCA